MLVFCAESINLMNKENLDYLLSKYKAQPVGSGYIDIIVVRSKYQSFAKELIENGFRICAISWWEYLDVLGEKNTYGMGGPKSKFYSGSFHEVAEELDKLPDNPTNLQSVIDTVENKDLGNYLGKQITYKDTVSVTPAFWLDVDKNWKNIL